MIGKKNRPSNNLLWSAVIVWEPTSEQDLTAADEAGVLLEDHRFEFKARLPEPGDRSNRELAKDLASLAVDGGQLVVGVQDIRDRPPTFTPIALSGLAERIDQIAAMRCDPPLFVACREIPSADNPDVGYLVVNVPPSPLAPHMVDGRYWGRDDRTKRALTDSEVALYIHRREKLRKSAEQELKGYIDRDPVEVARRQSGHFYGVAVPLGARHDSLLRALDPEQPMNDIRSVAFHRNVGQPYQPGLQQAGSAGHRPDGWAFASLPTLAQSREVGPADKESMVLELEISEAGVVRILNGRATERLPEPGVHVILDSLIVGMTAELVSLASTIGGHMGYAGTWALGVALRGPLQGLAPNSQVRDIRGLATPFSGDQFTEFAEATTPELTHEAGDVGLRLIGRFLRSLNLERSPNLREILSLPLD